MPKTKLVASAGTKGFSFRLFNSAGITATIGLASLPAFLTLAPLVAPNGAFADEPTANSNTGGAMALSVGRALAITAQNVNVTATPTVGNTFVTATSTVNVKNTGSSGGYHLIMSSENGGSLKDSNNSVNTFSEYTKTGAQMKAAGNSSWGWTLNPVNGTNSTPAVDNSGDTQAVYNPIPTSGTNWNKTGDQGTSTYAYLKNTDDYTDKVNGDNIVVGYGFAIGPDIPAGTYTDTITYTAIPNKDNRTIFDLSTMQDLSAYPDACANTPTPAVRTGDTPDTAVTASTTSLAGYSVGQTGIDKIPTKTLKDTRDNTEYTVKKLADGNCWMTTSLKIANRQGSNKLTSADSNVTTDFTLPAATASTGTSNSTDVAMVANDGVNSTYLYNWFAATAGTGTESLTNKQDAPGDICPKGWQLPNASGNMSWNKLLHDGQGIYQVATQNGVNGATRTNGYTNATVAWGSYAGISTATANPLGLQLTGDFSASHLEYANGGYYWTRTAHYDTALRAYYLGYDDIDVVTQRTDSKSYGFGLRCVAQGTEAKTPANTTYMQDIDSCPSTLPLEQKFTVKDKRDEKEYTVARLADGNCWMTSSLAVDGIDADTPLVLTSADSNVITDFELPAATASTGTSNSSDTAYVANDGVNGTYLYNWFAATAGTGTAAMVNTSAPSDICPKGWQLPNASGDMSWNKLLREGQGVYQIATSSNDYTNATVAWGTYAGISTAASNPLGLQPTSLFWGSKRQSTGNGNYWTRTAASSADNAYYLSYNSANVYPQYNLYKGGGRGVRCVLK